MINRVDISQDLTAANLAIIYQQAINTFGTIANDRQPDLSNSHFDDSTLELAKELFALDSNKKITPRKTGLKQALNHYRQNLATQQPLFYKICNQAAQELLKQKPYIQNPKIIICVSVYENETRISNLIKAIGQQNTPKEDISVYLFLNGPNLTTQEQRIRELNPNPKLDLRIIQSQIPTGSWCMGLKSITATTALLSLNLNTQADQDLTICFVDADILAFSHENFLNERSEKINRGMLIDGGSYKADPYLLKEININAGLIVEIEQNNNVIKQNLEKEFNQAMKHDTNSAPLKYLLLGGNSACSLMLLALASGMPVHARYFQDPALSSRTRGLLTKVFGNIRLQDLIAMGLGPSRQEAQSNYVLTDGGEALRALQLNYPLANAFMAHDPKFKSPILSQIDWTQPHTINLKRIHEEIKDMVERFFNSCANASHKNTNQYWSPALEAAFTKYLNQLETKINEVLKPNIIKFNIQDSETIEILLNDEKLVAKQETRKSRSQTIPN